MASQLCKQLATVFYGEQVIQMEVQPEIPHDFAPESSENIQQKIKMQKSIFKFIKQKHIHQLINNIIQGLM